MFKAYNTTTTTTNNNDNDNNNNDKKIIIIRRKHFSQNQMFACNRKSFFRNLCKGSYQLKNHLRKKH